MFKNVPETISPTQGITTNITARIGNDPGGDVSTMTGPSSGRTNLRAMFMGRQCLAFECMREAMGNCSISADFFSIDDRISKWPCNYDVFVLFLMNYELGMPSIIRQRMSELRTRSPSIPAMALLEDADADAATLRQMGFSTIIMGLPSLNFAVAAVRLLSLGAQQAAAAACDAAPPDQEPQLPGLSDVRFTKREIDLIERLESGMQNKLIAYQLGISESTVKAHLHNIMTKLHARNRTEAIFMLSQDPCRKQGAALA